MGVMRRRDTVKRRAASTLLVFLLFGLGCQDACQGCGNAIGKQAAEKITQSVNHAVDALPGLLDKIDQTIKNNIGAVDAALAHQIQEINKLLKENIDGINAALQATIDNVDAMLAARLDQIFKFAQGFLKDLDDLFAKRINQLGYNLEKLVRSLELSGTELLETAGFQVVRTIREGNRVVAVVIGGVVETVTIIAAMLVMVLVVVFAGIFYIRHRRLVREDKPRLVAWQLGLGAGFFGLVFVVATMMVFVPSARASVAAGRVTISEENVCTEVVPLAAAFVGEHKAAAPGSLTPEQNQEGAKLLGGLYQCMAQGAIADLRTKSRQYAADIERLVGAATRCRRNEECRTAQGEHCQVTTGLCTTRCDGPQHCVAGQLCHSPDTIGVCGPSCSAANPCAAGLACRANGQCEPAGPPGDTRPPGGPGGLGTKYIADGIIKDLLLKPTFGCPGPKCPIRVCQTGCGWTDPTPDGRPPGSVIVQPEAARDRLSTTKTPQLKDISRFFDPRLRDPRVVLPGGTR